MPELTEKELNNVRAFRKSRNPYVDAEELKKSDSKSKYVATCRRETVLLTPGSDRKQAPDENAPKRK